MKWLEEGSGGFGTFPTNQDLADILGRTDLHSENFHFFDFLDSRFLDSQISRFLDFQILGFSDSGISRFPYFQIQGCQPEIAGAWLRGGSGPQSW